MDKASDFGSEDCEFESRRGRNVFLHVYFFKIKFLPLPTPHFHYINIFIKVYAHIYFEESRETSAWMEEKTSIKIVKS